MCLRHNFINSTCKVKGELAKNLFNVVTLKKSQDGRGWG